LKPIHLFFINAPAWRKRCPSFLKRKVFVFQKDDLRFSKGTPSFFITFPAQRKNVNKSAGIPFTTFTISTRLIINYLYVEMPSIAFTSFHQFRSPENFFFTISTVLYFLGETSHFAILMVISGF